MTPRIIDRNMALPADPIPEVEWFDAETAPLVLEGFAFRRPGESLRRLPYDPRLSRNVNLLAGMSAGGILRFRTDSPVICVRAAVRTRNNTGDIMSYGRCGFDLYDRHGYIASSRLNFDRLKRTASFAALLLNRPNPTRQMRDFEINFPLYGNVETFQLGLAPRAKQEAPTPRCSAAPVVLYGTSIEQGCCASRPGLGPSNLLARQLNMTVLNFGFAGSALGEVEVAQYLAAIPDPAIYVLSYDANVDPARLRATLTPFCRILRKSHPAVPIITVSLPRMPGEREIYSGDGGINGERAARTRTHRANRKAIGGDCYFVDGASISGANFAEDSVDACHPNDIGILRWTERIACEIKKTGKIK